MAMFVDMQSCVVCEKRKILRGDHCVRSIKKLRRSREG